LGVAGLDVGPPEDGRDVAAAVGGVGVEGFVEVDDEEAVAPDRKAAVLESGVTMLVGARCRLVGECRRGRRSSDVRERCKIKSGRLLLARSMANWLKGQRTWLATC